ncbi:unnamed protein product [Linum trigynum]|uniref:Reverse transcriptase zinc-binding domain-containing protein n=1 Tax=Linum trigynum TaxID=586398 RepID=A0AAV2CEH1_9ROSI
MLSFRLPTTSCRRMNGQLSQYWWASQDKVKGIHWLSWPAICVSKFRGGLGFRDFDLFNIAMLAKQAWKLLLAPTSTLARMYKARYHPHCDFLHTTTGSRPSWAWQGVLAGRELLLKGLRWQVGCGTAIRILEDPWLPTSPPSSPSLLPGVHLPSLYVASLIDPLTRQWNIQLLQSYFTLASVHSILSIPIPLTPRPDRYIWHYSKTGQYSVKSGYHLLSDVRSELFNTLPPHLDARFWKWLWSLPVPPKLKFFLWRVVRGFLPCLAVLHTKNLSDSNVCSVCTDGVESISHCLFDCRVARAVWNLAGKDHVHVLLSGMTPDLAWYTIFFYLQLSKVAMVELVFLAWRIWKARCWSCYDKVQFLPGPLFRQFLHQKEEWIAATSPPSSHGCRLARPPISSPWPSCPPGGLVVRFDGATRREVGGSI